MIPKTNWEPSTKDIAWQRSMIDLLTAHSTWGVPGAQSAFEIDKPAKKFKLVMGDPQDETNRRIAKVFILLGFSEQSDNPLDRFDSSLN
jgi:hypothetical protein